MSFYFEISRVACNQTGCMGDNKMSCTFVCASSLDKSQIASDKTEFRG